MVNWNLDTLGISRRLVGRAVEVTESKCAHPMAAPRSPASIYSHVLGNAHHPCQRTHARGQLDPSCGLLIGQCLQAPGQTSTRTCDPVGLQSPRDP